MSRLWEAKIPCAWQTFQGVELCAQSGLNAEGSGGTFWDGYGYGRYGRHDLNRSLDFLGRRGGCGLVN